MKFRTADWLCLITIGVVAGLAAWLAPDIPAYMPTHWGIDGEPDAFGPKGRAIAMFVALPALAFGLLRLLPLVSPKGFRIDKFRDVYDVLMLAITLAIAGISIVALLQGVGRDIEMNTVTPLIIGGLMIVLGNYLGKVRRNFFIGIRTPWTLASDEVWARTHRVGAWLFVLAGLAIVIGGLATQRPAPVMLVAIGVAAGVSVVYSFVVYWRVHGFGDS